MYKIKINGYRYRQGRGKKSNNRKRLHGILNYPYKRAAPP